MSIFTTIRNALRRILGIKSPSRLHGSTTPAMPVRIPMPEVKPLKAESELPPSFALSVEIGEAVGCSLAADIEASPATMYANGKPFRTIIRMDSIDAFCAALRRIGEAAAEAAAALGAAVRAVTDADLIDRYGTPKEIRYIHRIYRNSERQQ